MAKIVNIKQNTDIILKTKLSIFLNNFIINKLPTKQQNVSPKVFNGELFDQ